MSYLIIDIETIPNKNMEKYLPEIKAPSNYKDDIKIQQYIQKNQLEQIPKMALDIDFAQIRAIGIWENDNPCANIYDLEALEKEKLEWFWENAKYKTLVGYNIISFDLPIILRRSLALGIVPTSLLRINKYSNDIIDLMNEFYHGGYITNIQGKKPFTRGLKKVCEMYEINNPLPDWDGSMVSEMNNKDLCIYLENDLRMTYELFKKMQGYYF